MASFLAIDPSYRIQSPLIRFNPAATFIVRLCKQDLDLYVRARDTTFTSEV